MTVTEFDILAGTGEEDGTTAGIIGIKSDVLEDDMSGVTQRHNISLLRTDNHAVRISGDGGNSKVVTA